jgi:uncharacterized membrane protein
MSRFSAFLHRTGERLALPAATRSLILVEVAADLDDLFQHYLTQGLSEDEAAARAEQKVDMSDEALAELVRVHSDMNGWSRRLVRRRQPLWERLAMGLIAVFFVAEVVMEFRPGIFGHTTVVLWLVLAVLAILIVSVIAGLTTMSGTPDLRRLRNGLATPLFLGAASLVIGFAGSAIDMYRAWMQMATDPKRAAAVMSGAILGTTTTLAFALIVALVAGTWWFVLATRLARLEDHSARTLQEVV